MLANQKSKHMSGPYFDAKIDIFLSFMLINFKVYKLQRIESLLILFVSPTKIKKTTLKSNIFEDCFLTALTAQTTQMVQNYKL
jgi:hypothetical protein